MTHSYVPGNVDKVKLYKAVHNDPIRAIMIQVYEFERDEQRLYLEAGAKTRMEPYLLSLFWCQVSDGPATWALLLLKWWARLQFVIPSLPADVNDASPVPKGMQTGNYYFQDFFTNSS